MTEPTQEHIVAALERAKELVDKNNFDLIRAPAEATTTAQCQGIEGFKVFRDTRKAVGNLAAGNRTSALAALDAAIKKVSA